MWIPNEFAGRTGSESIAADVATVTLGLANMKTTWQRQTRAEVQRLIDNISLRAQMNMFYLPEGWLAGSRRRAAEMTGKQCLKSLNFAMNSS